MIEPLDLLCLWARPWPGSGLLVCGFCHGLVHPSPGRSRSACEDCGFDGTNGSRLLAAVWKDYAWSTSWKTLYLPTGHTLPGPRRPMTRHENEVLAFRVYAGCSGRALADAERWRELALRASDAELAVAFMEQRQLRLESARMWHDEAVRWAATARASMPQEVP